MPRQGLTGPRAVSGERGLGFSSAAPSSIQRLAPRRLAIRVCQTDTREPTSLGRSHVHTSFILSTSTLAFAALCGCTGVSPSGLRADGTITALTSELPAETAYRRIVEGSRACYDSSFDVIADYFPTAQSGRVSASMKAMVGVSAAYVVDTSPAGTGTSIRGAAHQMATAVPANVTRWLAEDYKHCKLR
jgi:hypothetical protein